eukprot:CAMPEP_0174327124 /NCGR_PEP_ID=MMETSP0810-20121108/14332_1 /TAXON_ID=73025 ORGANISM="Eutreptiella gymnastica-like, Strain CCMP1594" /NCGR_SAMPLE_ID=MMETSP0810 /ASSEMBLY_ACC=CAM_ASM_000659 /LENGTH=291 /DNA_ID=CAMNT_0015440915 /DNA_START=28 /DNA_END=903 /DNA_ORIENTATION=+
MYSTYSGYAPTVTSALGASYLPRSSYPTAYDSYVPGHQPAGGFSGSRLGTYYGADAGYSAYVSDGHSGLITARGRSYRKGTKSSTRRARSAGYGYTAGEPRRRKRTVQVVRGDGLLQLRPGSNSAYVELKVGRDKCQTTTKHQNGSVVWGDVFEIPAYDDDEMSLRVIDSTNGRSAFLGGAVIAIADLMNLQGGQMLEVELTNEDGPAGRLLLRNRRGGVAREPRDTTGSSWRASGSPYSSKMSSWGTPAYYGGLSGYSSPSYVGSSFGPSYYGSSGPAYGASYAPMSYYA